MVHQETIDKVPFKITLPVLIAVIIATISSVVALANGYYNIQKGISDVNARVAQVYSLVQNGNEQHVEFKDELNDHESRIRVLEKK